MSPSIGAVDPRTLARRSDPSTSHEAAMATVEFASSQRELVLAALPRLPHAPSGAEEIADKCGLSSYTVRKRLPELQAQGLAFVGALSTTTRSGRRERTWFAL